MASPLPYFLLSDKFENVLTRFPDSLEFPPVSELCEVSLFGDAYWKKKCEENRAYELLDHTRPYRPILSFSPDAVKEVFGLFSDWQAEAASRVRQMTIQEKTIILSDFGIGSFELSGSSSCQTGLPDRKSAVAGETSVDASASVGSILSPQSSHSESASTIRRKRTPLMKQRNLPLPKLSRHMPSKPPPKVQKRADPEQSTIPPHDQCEDEDEEDEEEEDQLTTIVRRQRETFSARVAAGRPSARNAKPAGETNEGASSVSVAQSSKLWHAWKKLSRKEASKTGRQWIACRRERMIVAKRVARECSRIMRQKALLSQKLARDATVRARRLARDLMVRWRELSTALSAGTGPLTVNGVVMPLDVSLFRPPDSNGKTDTGCSEGTVTESATIARRRAEKAAAEQRRADIELLEARRQQRKLNFLITQTELYAHFMARKMDDFPAAPTSADNRASIDHDAERILKRLENSDDAGRIETSTPFEPMDPSASCDSSHFMPESSTASVCTDSVTQPIGSSVAEAAKEAARRLGVKIEDEYDVDLLKSRALDSVRMAVDRERDRVANYGNPRNTMMTPLRHSSADHNVTQIEAPRLFQGQLKAYQLRGLNWLLGLFDQGINGILADEMGLGKTIQSIAFLGHLAERYDIWGPFLIVAPASTLHNWTQEFAKFLPAFRIVPYWGSPTERKVLRRFWFSSAASKDLIPSTVEDESVHRRILGTRHAEMHAVVTSYQIVLQDAKFLNRTAWSYIVLDEAHAIKSTSSLRWRVLLSFKCRNRLLLTGTPIQNTMQELWALLHFIMPTLFDSHDEFANWFSRDIETQVTATASSSGGSALATAKLNENQLSRLHLILKPFMLRRTKMEVEHEISTKTEILRYCPLSGRQRALYSRLRSKIRFEDLNCVLGSINVDNPELDTSTTARLINLVMQLRKVCNHPDLWEPRDARFSCVLGCIRPSPTLAAHTEPMISRSVSPIWELPRLFYEEDLIPEWYPGVSIGLPINHVAHLSTFQRALICRFFALFHPFNIHRDLWPVQHILTTSQHRSVADRYGSQCSPSVARCFSFAWLMRLSPWELTLSAYSLSHALRLLSQQYNSYHPHVAMDANFKRNTLSLLITPCSVTTHLQPPLFQDCWHFHPQHRVTVPCIHVEEDCQPKLLPPLWGLFIPKVSLPPLTLHLRVPYSSFKCNAHYPSQPVNALHPTVAKIVYDPWCDLMALSIPCLQPCLELVRLTTKVSDSGKLVALDSLLNELKPAGHRVLIYSQMTRMIDILEEFMIYRKHNYLRLDGSSRLCDRRDMVAQWQSNPRWFVFLLSTRAGGLGINLTAADTVIFYDSDWNPTVDQQAMDRAHRLGQTKPVTVYRLVCKNTIEERMMQRAEEKRAMQQMVIQSGQSTAAKSRVPKAHSGDQLTSADMVSLLLDDEELIKRIEIRRQQQMQRGRSAKQAKDNNPHLLNSFRATEMHDTAATVNSNSKRPTLKLESETEEIPDTKKLRQMYATQDQEPDDRCE